MTIDSPTETTKAKTKRQPSAAFLKPVAPDALLSQVIGGEPLSRTDVTKKLWDYIRVHNLQDPSNKTFILADDKLRPIFSGESRVSMFEMTKHVFKHVT